MDAVAQIQEGASSCGMALRAGAADSGDSTDVHVSEWGSVALKAWDQHHLVVGMHQEVVACMLEVVASDPCLGNTLRLVEAYRVGIAYAAYMDRAHTRLQGLEEPCQASLVGQGNHRGDNIHIRERQPEQPNLLRRMEVEWAVDQAEGACYVAGEVVGVKETGITGRIVFR